MSTHFGTRSAVVSLKKLMVGWISIECNYSRETRHLNEFFKSILIKILTKIKTGVILLVCYSGSNLSYEKGIYLRINKELVKWFKETHNRALDSLITTRQNTSI